MPRPLCPATSAASAAAMFQPLFGGPIEVIGDIHGECGTLRELLDRLGYDGNGAHPEGRRLVFVGDLMDRGGPDSPGVARRLVRHLIEQVRRTETEVVRVYMPCRGCSWVTRPSLSALLRLSHLSHSSSVSVLISPG